MDFSVIGCAQRITPELFGDTDITGGIPLGFCPSPSTGPVYLEGQLVLALSFQGDGHDVVITEDKPLYELRLWDVLSDTWFLPSLTMLRYEGHDVVLVDGAPVYRGIVDTTADITLMPGWDSTCTGINGGCFLAWRSV